MRTRRQGFLAAVAAAVVAISGSALAAHHLTEQSAKEMKPPFGGEANVKYALGL
ncbi:MAG: hypothetical protein R3316_08340 [Rhodovibrionaceae bacterium]|nr:hypothetical protein [Rhodovibrionaceae bacterium]